MLAADVPYRGLSTANENQKQALRDLRIRKVFFRKLVLTLPHRTIYNRNAFGLRIGTKTAAETARQAHQMSIVQRFIRSSQRPPPQTKATWIMPHAKVGIQHDPVYAIVAASYQIRISITQRVRHVSQLNTNRRHALILPSGFLGF